MARIQQFAIDTELDVKLKKDSEKLVHDLLCPSDRQQIQRLLNPKAKAQLIILVEEFNKCFEETLLQSMKQENNEQPTRELIAA